MMPRTFGGIAICLVMLLSFGCSGKPGAQGPTVGFLQFVDDPQLDRAALGFQKALESQGFVDGRSLKLVKRCAQGEMANIPLILKAFEDQNVALVGTSTTPCMVAAAQLLRSIPFVCSVTFSPADAGFTGQVPNMSCLYDPFDAEGFVSLLQEFIPGVQEVGILYTPSEPNAVFATGKVMEVCEKRGITVSRCSVQSINDIRDVAAALASQNVQAFVATADNTVYAGLSAMLGVAQDNRIPVFVSDPVMVGNGAAVGLGLDYYDWGYQGGLVAAQILKGKPVTAFPSRPYQDYRLYFSEKNCRLQGLGIPESVRRRANRIYDEAE